jgi:hypothetical protein
VDAVERQHLRARHALLRRVHQLRARREGRRTRAVARPPRHQRHRGGELHGGEVHRGHVLAAGHRNLLRRGALDLADDTCYHA